jgi:ubiquinol-cytochrome c reductase cytochrome b subunit
MRKRIIKNNLLAIVNNQLVDYPTAANISYYWGLGSLAGIILARQIVTGIFRAMHYTPHVDMAFISVEHIMRDVNNGWLMRYGHANGASFFFIVVYMHIMRGMYYGSYISPRGILWGSGVIIFIRMMGTGFIGYVLPFGQMSLWGATVITNRASAVPFVGDAIVQWLWGGFSVDNATRNRFYSLHFTRPFVIAALARIHLVRLHAEGVGSGNPIGVEGTVDAVPFYPYFYVKDRLGFVGRMIVYTWFIFYAPNAMGHPDNYIEANAMVTPPHIVPEWYFRMFYAIRRSIPHKRGGVVAMRGALVRLLFLPRLNTSQVRSTTFRPVFAPFYWFFIGNCLVLGWIGQKAVAYPYVEIGQIGTIYYFMFLIVLIPLIGRYETSVMNVVKAPVGVKALAKVKLVKDSDVRKNETIEQA